MTLLRVTTWLRAATQRLHAARVLFDDSLYVDAAYLGGYVVECAIKGYVLARVPMNQRRQYIEERFRSARAHDFVYLQWLAAKRGSPLPARIVERVRRIVWSTDLRYTVGLGDHDEAQEIITSGEQVLEWARNNA
ncbi:MAG: HEPN domain-containing protein [Planctomycetaceae bacterium]